MKFFSFNLFNSIGKKVYGIIALLIFSMIIVLILGVAGLHAIDGLVALTRAERDHTVNYYQGASSFQNFLRTGNEELFREMEAHLETTLGESKRFGSITDDLQAGSIASVAAELDRAFPTVDAWQAKKIVIMAKLFSGNPILKSLVEISQGAYSSGSEYLVLTKAYRTVDNPDEKIRLLARMEELNQELDKLSRRFSTGVQHLSAWALSLVQKILIGVFLFFSAAAIAIAAKVISSISKPMKSVVAFSEGMAKGNFSGRLTAISRDETGQLIHAINQICMDVGESIRRIGDTSRTVSEGADAQSAATRQTADALEGITATIKGTATHAQEANGLTRNAVEIVEEADGLIGILTESLGRLSEKSVAAQKIIKTIDEIAFQTNLLAINASVEAARAGDAGAGFAVVAGEVKKLAMRSAEAAKSTQEQIDGIVQKVNEGTESMKNTATVFEKLTQIINRIESLIGDIAEYSEEQARGIDDIGASVSDIDRVVGENAKSAKALEQGIAFFKTDGDIRNGNGRGIYAEVR